MSKVSFANLKLKTIEDVKEIDFNGAKIEVKQYLPISDKYDLIMITLQQAYEDRVYNPLKIEVFFHLNLIYLYTNINFTDKQKEDPAKLYDLIISSGLWDSISSNLNVDDYTLLLKFINETIEAYYKYHNSVFGIIESINRDYEQMDLDATEIQKKLADPENMALLKDVLTKLG